MKKTWIILIAAAALVVLGLVVFLANGKAQPETPEAENETTQTTEQLPEDTQPCNVQFKTEDGVTIQNVQVQAGQTAVPPVPPDIAGRVFSHWEGTFENVQAGTTVTAIYQPSAEKHNLICAKNAYVACGSEFAVTMGIYGDVKLCGLELVVKYDPQLLQFLGFENEDPGIIINHVEAENAIYMNFASSGNTTGEVTFADMRFMAIGSGKAETGLEVTVNELIAFREDGAFVQETADLWTNKIIMIEGDA